MERYFLGGNSHNGFFSYYENSIDKIDNVIMLKGGAGTGKSTLMKSVAKIAKGKGFDVEEWYCSGDPNSLDGVYIKNKNIAVVDATSPHNLDPKFPVIKDKIVNLAVCLDREKLVCCYDDIKKYANRKKQCYSYAYEQLNIALCEDMKMERLSKSGVDEKKIRRFASHFADSIFIKLDKNPDCNKRFDRRLFSRAITPDGEVEFFDHLNNKKIYEVSGTEYATKVFLDEVEKTMDVDVILCNPLTPFDIEGVISGDVAIVKRIGQFENNVADRIDLAVFENGIAENEMDIAFEEKSRHIKVACDYLAKARANHLEIEKHFVNAMNFEKLDIIRREVVENIFNR